MKVLILGGTRFLGRHFATEVLLRKHELTLFNRGQSSPGLFAQADQRQGDRDGSLEALETGEWDLCIDTSAQAPHQVEATAKLLRERVGRYCLISTASVYRDSSRAPLLESAPLVAPEATRDKSPATYAGRKVGCEQAARKAFGDRALVLRPGLLAGPFDTTGRVDYWLRRARSGGELLAPGPAHDPIQCLDARDLARFALDLAEREVSGTFNVAGPSGTVTFEDLVSGAVRATASVARVTWVDPGFLLERGVEPWTELPVWIPEDGARGLHGLDVGAAEALGLRITPLDQTLRDTLIWLENTSAAPIGGVGLDPARERQLLSEWHRAEALARAPLAAGHEI